MEILRIRDFSGGLNNRFRQNRIADNELASCRNVRWTRYGALSKRPGTSRNVVTNGSGTNLTRLMSAFSYQLTGMANEQLLLYGVDASSQGIVVRSTSIGTYTDVVTGLTNIQQHCNFVAFNDLVYFSDGNSINPVRQINPSNVVANVAAFPLSQIFTVHKGYMFTFNDNTASDRTSRLSWSAFGDASTWPSSNFENIQPADAARGSGMISFGDELILFKSPWFQNQSYSVSSMWSVIGDIFDPNSPTYQISRIPLDSGVGLLTLKGMKIYRGNLLFLTNDGVYVYEGGLRRPYPISETIRGDIDNWTHTFGTNQFSGVSATVFKDRFYGSVCANSNVVSNDSGSTEVSMVNYVIDQGKFWREMVGGHFSLNISQALSPVEDWVTFHGNLYGVGGGIDTNVGMLRQFETSDFLEVTDSGQSVHVNSAFSTKEFDLGRDFRLSHCYVHLRRQSSGTLTFGVNVNQTGVMSNSIDMTAPLGETTETTSSNILRQRVTIDRVGRTIQFNGFHVGNNDFEIYEIELHGQPIGEN